MPELTADVVLKKIKSGEKVERADLRGIALPKALLEGVSFRRSDLDGANLEGARLGRALLNNASLREAFLAGADLRDANLESADLEGANLQGANLQGANLNRANLEGANLQGADLSRARLTHAQIAAANLGGANLTGALLVHAVLVEADLSTAKLEGADLSNADLAGANLEEANLTNAKMRDARTQGANMKNANLTGADGASSGGATPGKRYFGKGDVLRNAHLEFDSGASVEIESLFEQCTIALGKGTELVVGKSGVLSGCQIKGAGLITIHGKFVERESPGIVGATQLVVTAGGSLVGAVEQPPEQTRFAFEPGCMLRMKIQQAKRPIERASKSGRQR
jgi:uncharacterized protein YjbI with pentapeptide repeats